MCMREAVTISPPSLMEELWRVEGKSVIYKDMVSGRSVDGPTQRSIQTTQFYSMDYEGRGGGEGKGERKGKEEDLQL